MDEKKFVTLKKQELEIREYIKNSLGKGRISEVGIEYTPVGEKIIVSTNKPGLVIGTRGEKITQLTITLKKRFKLDNPQIEIREIVSPLFDAQLVADEIALGLERKGSLKFKLIAYRFLSDIISAGALGAEIVLSGKLPSDRAKSWRFAQGYLKKTGDPAKVVNRAMAQAKTMSGVIGIKVSILAPDAKIHDKVVVDQALVSLIKSQSIIQEVSEEVIEKPTKKKRSNKKEISTK